MNLLQKVEMYDMHNVTSYSRISAALSAHFLVSFWFLYKQRNN